MLHSDSDSLLCLQLFAAVATGGNVKDGDDTSGIKPLAMSDEAIRVSGRRGMEVGGCCTASFVDSSEAEMGGYARFKRALHKLTFQIGDIRKSGAQGCDSDWGRRKLRSGYIDGNPQCFTDDDQGFKEGKLILNSNY